MKQPKKSAKKKSSGNPADSYPNKKDERGFPTIGGGEGRNPSGPSVGRLKPTYGGAKSGGRINSKKK